MINYFYKLKVIKEFKEEIWRLSLDIVYNEEALAVCYGLIRQQEEQLNLEGLSEEVKKRTEDNLDKLKKTRDELNLLLDKFKEKRGRYIQKLKFIRAYDG